VAGHDKHKPDTTKCCGSEPLLANVGRSHCNHSAAGAASHKEEAHSAAGAASHRIPAKAVSKWERAPARECWPEPLQIFGRRGSLPQGRSTFGRRGSLPQNSRKSSVQVGASPCSRMLAGATAIIRPGMTDGAGITNGPGIKNRAGTDGLGFGTLRA
jgi:hypothetical protein